MKWKTHAQMVAELTKNPKDMRLTLGQLDLWHAATGVATEAGELLSTIKAHVIYQREIDRENIIEELGDLEFYTERIRQNQNITREEVLNANMVKLNKRYGTGYSDVAAQERADKNG